MMSVKTTSRKSVQPQAQELRSCQLEKEEDNLLERSSVSPAPDEAVEEAEENVLANPDETTDVIFEVEGRELHACRAVLAHYSPVFRAMFSSTFKESSLSKIPLPGKKYKTMVTFFNVLYPRSVSAACLIDDHNLIELLTVADEYQADKVLAVGQDYIGEKLFHCFHTFYQYSIKYRHSGRQPRREDYQYSQPRREVDQCSQPRREDYQYFECQDKCQWVEEEASSIAGKPYNASELIRRMRGQNLSKEAMIQKLTLYLWACDCYQLPSHRDDIKSLLVDLATCLNDVTQSKHYPCLPPDSKVDLLEALCSKLDGSRVF